MWAKTGISSDKNRLRAVLVGGSLLLVFLLHDVCATNGTGTLNVVTQTGFNIMNVTVTPSIASGSTKQTTLTGSVVAKIAADPLTGACTALTLSGDNLFMTNLSYSWLLGLAKLQIQNMGAYASTVDAPSPVTPNSSGGSFDGSLHKLIINRGTASGIAGADFSVTPINGKGTGTGTLTMVAGESTATHRTYMVTLVIPVDFTDIVNEGAATVRVQGTLKSTGTITFPVNEFIGWTDEKGIPGASFTDPLTVGAAPLGMAWAAGLEPTTPVGLVTPAIQSTPSDTSATLMLPETGTRAPLWIESCTDLLKGVWSPVAGTYLSTGANPIPAGTMGPVTIQMGTGPSLFIRPRVDPP